MASASLLGVLMGFLLTFRGFDPSVAKLPRNFVLGGVYCRESEAVIVGGREMELKNVGSPAQKFDALVLRVVNGVFSVVNVGPGVVLDLSCPEGDIIYAVRDEVFASGKTDRHVLMRSSDFGATWNGIETAPRDVVGASFYSGDSGYAWSTDHIYYTADQGRTWSGLPAAEGMMFRTPKPVVDSQGNLWVAINQGPGYQRLRNGLVRVTPDLSAEPILEDISFNVWQMEADWPANLLMVTEESERGRIVLKRLETEKSSYALTVIAELPSGLPTYLWSVGPGMVVMVDTPFSESPKSTVLLSRDRGMSWKAVDIPEPGINCMCAWDADSIWYVGTSGTIFRP